jgi:hypothetical protein
MHVVGFEPTCANTSGPKPDALDHSAIHAIIKKKLLKKIMLEAGLEPATLGYLIITIRPTLYQLSYTSLGDVPDI